jgi:hypothetical protein
MSSRFSNVRPFRGRQQRALDSTTAPVPDEDINQLVERGDPVRQLPALKLLPRLQRGRSDRDSHPVAPEQGVPHAAAPSVQGRESALLFFALSNSAAVDGFHFFAHNHTRGGMPWVRLTGGGGRSQRDPRTENTRRRVRQRSMVRGLHFHGTDGASGYGGREMSSIPHKPLLTPASASRSQARTPAASSTSILSRASAVRTSSRTSGSREAFQREQRPARHGLLGRLWIIEYTRASAFVFGSVGSLRMAPYCSSVVSRPAFTRNGLKFGLSAGQSANCLLEGRAVQI